MDGGLDVRVGHLGHDGGLTPAPQSEASSSSSTTSSASSASLQPLLPLQEMSHLPHLLCYPPPPPKDLKEDQARHLGYPSTPEYISL
jgi:hypothetical protein